ncbi:hypothetical protein Tco_1368454 [Tanacetum coccineum]
MERAVLAVLITGTSQSRQHGMSEPVRSRGSDFDIPVVFSLIIALLRNKDGSLWIHQRLKRGLSPNGPETSTVTETDEEKGSGGFQIYSDASKERFGLCFDELGKERLVVELLYEGSGGYLASVRIESKPLATDQRSSKETGVLKVKDCGKNSGKIVECLVQSGCKASLEKDLKQTKLTMGSAIVKLVKKVKKMEGILKRRNVVLSDSEEEESEAQGRKSQDDPLVSLVQGLVTPSKTTVNTSGEEQVEEISPTTLEVVKTLSRVASQKPKSIDKGRRYKRRKDTKGKKVVTSLDFQEEVSTGAEGVNTGSIKVSTVSGQEEASLVEAIRLDSLEKEEEAKQIHLDSLLAQRIAEVEELNKQQKKRRAQVQFEAQHYTDEDWDLIRAKMKLDAEVGQRSVLGSDDESTKKTRKKRKQIARKGLHSDKTDEDESEDSKDNDPILGTNIPINPIPMAIKSSSIATYKIIKQREKGVLDVDDITRDDLTELYRIVMNRYGMNGPEDELEKEQTALGKDFSNPLMADNLPKKLYWLSITLSGYKELASHKVYRLWVAEKALKVDRCKDQKRDDDLKNCSQE